MVRVQGKRQQPLHRPQGRRITRRRCKPGHPARGGRSWVTNTITSPARTHNAHPSPTMAASPPGCWHKSNGSRYTSPQNRLYPPPGEPGTVYGQLITTKTGPARPAQWAPPPGIRPHGSPQRHNATPGQLYKAARPHYPKHKTGGTQNAILRNQRTNRPPCERC